MKPILLTAALALAPAAMAQPRRSACMAGTLVTAAKLDVSGRIASIGTDPSCAVGRGGFVRLELKDAQGASQSVDVAPASFLQQQGLNLAIGDDVAISGYAMDGVLVAALIKKGDKSVTLRNDQGLPLWRGGPRMGRGRSR